MGGIGSGRHWPNNQAFELDGDQKGNSSRGNEYNVYMLRKVKR